MIYLIKHFLIAYFLFFGSIFFWDDFVESRITTNTYLKKCDSDFFNDLNIALLNQNDEFCKKMKTTYPHDFSDEKDGTCIYKNNFFDEVQFFSSDDCYAEFAKKYKDPSYCFEITTIMAVPYGRNKCLIEFEKSNGFNRGCERLSADNCYIELAKFRQDESVCENLSESSFEYRECIIGVAKIKNDQKLCKKIPKCYWQQDCFFETKNKRKMNHFDLLARIKKNLLCGGS